MTPARKAAKAQPIQEMAETIGVRLALKLVEIYGGLDIQFPSRPHDDHPVIVALGKEDGYAICRYMAGSKLSVPHQRPPKSARVDIGRLEAEGLSQADIAQRLGLTQRHVRRYTGSAKNKRQGDLFES